MAISTHDRKILWGRSGGLCAKCDRPLIEDATANDREALASQECHIVSAAPNGPRHGPEPPGGYDGLGNQLLLCSTCHVIVDSQPATYPRGCLRDMKARHERRVRALLTGGDLPRLQVTPLPDNIELDLVVAGRQLVRLLTGNQDFAIDHDQPRSDDDAELIASVAEKLHDADLALDALGPAEAVRLAHDLQRFITEELLPGGLVLYGAVVPRSLLVDGTETPWRSCVLTVRYAPKAVHGESRGSQAEGSVDEEIRRLLKEGRRLRGAVHIPLDGASGPIEVWEQEVIATLETRDRPDLAERFEVADASDLARGLVSAKWRTTARFDRQLRVLSSFIRAEASD